MKFSVMFWNVEKYSGDADRSLMVRGHIRGQDPDVFCLCEIRDKAALRNLIMEHFQDYDFAVTDGVEGIELFTGWRRGRFEQVLFTQRREFKADSANLRPGALCSVKFEGDFYNLLFLHTDSGTTQKDYNNRLAMFEKVWSLKTTLDGITEGGDSFLMAAGDLNTMGRKAQGEDPAVSAGDEIANLASDANQAGMRMLVKNQAKTLAWGSPHLENFRYSNLDHVIATQNLSFEPFDGDAPDDQAEVSVKGWIDLENQEREDFVNHVSDHCSIYWRVL